MLFQSWRSNVGSTTPRSVVSRLALSLLYNIFYGYILTFYHFADHKLGLLLLYLPCQPCAQYSTSIKNELSTVILQCHCLALLLLQAVIALL